jgi:hypothetical protein
LPIVALFRRHGGGSALGLISPRASDGRPSTPQRKATHDRGNDHIRPAGGGTMNIGELASAAETKAETIRYNERIGLSSPLTKSAVI